MNKKEELKNVTNELKNLSTSDPDIPVITACHLNHKEIINEKHDTRFTVDEKRKLIFFSIFIVLFIIVVNWLFYL